MEFIRDIFRLLGSIFFIIIIACGINSCVNEKRQMAKYHNSWEYHVKQKNVLRRSCQKRFVYQRISRC